MRKLKLQVQASVDGYMAGPNGEVDWMSFDWSDDVGAYINGIMESVDTVVLGRKLAEGFIPAWQSRPEVEPEESIDWMNDTPKVVVSDSLTEPPWGNATVVGTDVAQTIGDLKQQPGGDLIVYGGGTLVRSLIAANLIDDLHLIVNPTAVGSGMPIFPDVDGNTQLRLVQATPFACGMFALHYAPGQA